MKGEFMGQNIEIFSVIIRRQNGSKARFPNIATIAYVGKVGVILIRFAYAFSYTDYRILDKLLINLFHLCKQFFLIKIMFKVFSLTHTQSPES